MKNKNGNGAVPVPIAFVIGAVIVAFFAFVVKGSEIKFGIVGGWLTPMMIALFMAIGARDGIGYEALKKCILGCIYGIVIGTCFSIFIPLFVIGVVVLIAMKASGKAEIIMNDYALALSAIYTIPGVSNTSHLLQDILMAGIGIVIVIIICIIKEKKGGTKTDGERVTLPEGSEKKSYYKYINEPLIPVSDDEIYKYTHTGKKSGSTGIQESFYFNKQRLYAGTGRLLYPG